MADHCRPNILFVFPDQWRFDWVNNPALPLRTPNLQRLAAKGASFSNAICPAPLCGPCRAALATGRRYQRCGVPNHSHDMPLDLPTFYQLLRESGYHVAGCGKFDLHKASPVWGLEGKHSLFDWGFDDGIDCEGKMDGVESGSKQAAGPYMSFLEQRGLRETHLQDFRRRAQDYAVFPTPLPDDAYCDNWIGQTALDLCEAAPAEKPLFLQVNFAGPHSPWDVTEEMTTWYDGVDFPLPRDIGGLDPDGVRAVRRNYAAMITNIDRWVGMLQERLQVLGRGENLLVVFASDHGEMLGERGLWEKKLPYHPSVGVPLIVEGGGIFGPQRLDVSVSILDLSATFLDFAGLETPAEMDSRSLKKLLRTGRDPQRRIAVSALGEWALAYDGRYKYVRGFGETQMLYDRACDPAEQHNLFGVLPETASRLEGELNAVLSSNQ